MTRIKIGEWEPTEDEVAVVNTALVQVATYVLTETYDVRDEQIWEMLRAALTKVTLDDVLGRYVSDLPSAWEEDCDGDSLEQRYLPARPDGWNDVDDSWLFADSRQVLQTREQAAAYKQRLRERRAAR